MNTNFPGSTTGMRLSERSGRDILIEAEHFAQHGGWAVDQQVMDQMGSPYLLAHGLGIPVADATTTVAFPAPGEYRVWVRTRDWVGPWKQPGTPLAMQAVGSPGAFNVLIDGQALSVVFGTEGAAWHWQDGGIIQIRNQVVTLALHDLTGFEGRCDAILFCANHQAIPPNSNPALQAFRRALSVDSDLPSEMGPFDLVVVGGGIAGCCAAISAARLGCRVALLQDRPVLGGNNSSDVRVGLSGLIHQLPYPRLGDVVDEIGPIGHWTLWDAEQNPDTARSRHILDVIKNHPEKTIHNAGPASNYEDQQKIDVVQAEKNIRLFLNMHVTAAEVDGARIMAVIAQNICTGERLKFSARLFSDCSGDGNLGFLAKADFSEGRESRKETGEDLAADVEDSLVMGTSVQWYAEDADAVSTFPECPWAVQFDEQSCIKTTRGDWDWETGATRDQIMDFEQIRDYSFRTIYGNWAVLKNNPSFKDEFARHRLAWVACIGGKRESRRLLGDVVLRQQDIVEQRVFPDACVTTTWTIDLHFPLKPVCACEAFQSEARHLEITPYPIPFRCFYSRNIENLMMAGRNISVTHVALGTVRVMRTTGMMGEVLGMAAWLCTRHSTTPRGVFLHYLDDLTQLMQCGVGKQKQP